MIILQSINFIDEQLGATILNKLHLPTCIVVYHLNTNTILAQGSMYDKCKVCGAPSFVIDNLKANNMSMTSRSIHAVCSACHKRVQTFLT